MKYLLLNKSYSWQDSYELKEFASQAELTKHLTKEGIPENAIVAQRVGLQLQICEWAKPETDTADGADSLRPALGVQADAAVAELQQEAA